MASVSKPLIQAPKFFNKQLSNSLLKTKIKIRDRERQENFRNQNLLVISCKKSGLNHYYNHNYSNHKKLPLASEGWGNTKSKGDTFTINPYEKNPAVLTKSSNELYPFINNNCQLSTKDYDGNGHLKNKEHIIINTKSKNESNIFDTLHSEIKALLDLFNYQRPTNIQAKTLNILLKRKSLIITSETGSGKTLAYLLPTLNYLLENSDHFKNPFPTDFYDKNTNLSQKTEYPFVVVLAPTKELCYQIYDVIKKFANPLKLRTVLHIGGLKIDTFEEDKQHLTENCSLEADSFPKLDNNKPLHILVSMPGILNKLTRPAKHSFNMVDSVTQPDADRSMDGKSNPPPPTGLRSGKGRIYDLSAVKTLVIDEADTLLDDSFSDDTLPLINTCQGEDMGCNNQLILVGATRPTSLDQILGPSFFEEGYLSSVQTGAAHHVMPHVSQTFERLIKPDRDDRLVAILSKSLVAPPRSSRDRNKLPPPPPPVTLIFCQDHVTVDHVTRCLKERLAGYGYYSPSDSHHDLSKSLHWIEARSVIEALHSKMDSRRRAEIFQRFYERKNPGPTYPVLVLITTDLLSRGIDTGFVELVINYDFPKYISDYIHRVGRVGRVHPSGCNSVRPGRVINFVSSKREAALVKVVEESVRRNKPLFNVNANIKRKIVALAEQEQAGFID